MKNYLSKTQTKKIMGYAEEFFNNQENCSEFTKYFLILTLARAIYIEESIFALEELNDEITPPALKFLFRLTCDEFWKIDEDPEMYLSKWKNAKYSEEVFIKEEAHYKNLKAKFDDFLQWIFKAADKNEQFLALFALSGIQEILKGNHLSNKGHLSCQMYKYLLSFIPDSCSDFKNIIRHDISLEIYLNSFDPFESNKCIYPRVSRYSFIILLNTQNPDLMFVKKFYNFPMFYHFLMPGDFDKIPEDGIIMKTNSKYLVSAKTNKDGSFNIVTSDKENPESDKKKPYKPVLFTTKSGDLISRLRIGGKEVWFMNNEQLSVPVNGENSEICGKIIAYKRNNIPYFCFDGKEYNGCPVYAPVQGFVYLENGAVHFRACFFPSHKMRHSPIYDKKKFKYMINDAFKASNEFLSGKPLLYNPDEDTSYMKAEAKLSEIYKTSISAYFAPVLQKTEHKLICSDEAVYIWFPEIRKYFTIFMEEFKKDPGKCKGELVEVLGREITKN